MNQVIIIIQISIMIYTIFAVLAIWALYLNGKR